MLQKKRRKNHTSHNILPTGRSLPVDVASVACCTPHIPFPSFHLWFMGCLSIFLAFFLFSFFGLFCYTFSSWCQYVLSILFTSVAEKPGVKFAVFLKLSRYYLSISIGISQFSSLCIGKNMQLWNSVQN